MQFLSIISLYFWLDRAITYLLELQKPVNEP